MYQNHRPFLVRVTGVEPARLSAREPKSRMSANSIIPADIHLLSVHLNKIQHFRVKVKQKQHEIVRISVEELTDIVLIIAFATADKQQCETNEKSAQLLHNKTSDKTVINNSTIYNFMSMRGETLFKADN